MTTVRIGSSVREFVESLDIPSTGTSDDALARSRADIAVTLADVIDGASQSTSVGVVQSIPSLSKELRETLTELAGLSVAATSFVEQLFA